MIFHDFGMVHSSFLRPGENRFFALISSIFEIFSKKISGDVSSACRGCGKIFLDSDKICRSYFEKTVNFHDFSGFSGSGI